VLSYAKKGLFGAVILAWERACETDGVTMVIGNTPPDRGGRFFKPGFTLASVNCK